MAYIAKIDKTTVGELLSSLFNRECVAFKEGVPEDVNEDMAVRGRFVDDGGKLVALAMSDIPFAAFAGAAIAMLPVGGAEDAVDNGALEGTLEEAYGEVLNVLSRLFNLQGRPHCRYTDMEAAPLEPCPIEAEISARFRVEIPGYGSGRLTLLAA